MHPILTLAFKDLKLVTRDWFALFWMLAFPLLFALFFGSLMAGIGTPGARGMPVAVVDQENSEGSRAFVERLEQLKGLKIEHMSLPDAKEAVTKGKLVAYVVIQSGFANAPTLFGGPPRQVELGIDPSRRAETEYVRGMVMETAFGDLKKMFGGGEKGQGREPIQVKVQDVSAQQDRPRSGFEISFPSSIMWALMGCVAGFSISIVVERTQGTLLRLRTCPLTQTQLLAGKGTACFLTSALVAVMLLAFAGLVLGVRLGNLGLLALAVVSTAICFTGLMMFFSTLGKTEAGVAGAGWGLMMPMAMLGGGMVPLIFMPEWMQDASNASPVKWGIVALEGAIWRGFDLADMLLPCGILLGVGALFYGTGVWSLSRRQT